MTLNPGVKSDYISFKIPVGCNMVGYICYEKLLEISYDYHYRADTYTRR